MATELKDKAPPVGRRLAGAGVSVAAVVGTGKPAEPLAAAPGGSAAREGAVSALLNLGYGEGEARQAAAAAARTLGEAADEAALIRTALKELAR